MTHRLYIFSLLLILTGCIKHEPSQDQLVVEGWIENGEAPVVFVTSSVTDTFSEQTLQDFVSHIALNAKVTVTYQGTEYKLQPHFTSKYFLGMYYTNPDLKGETGGTYQLDVQWHDMHAIGTTTIPEPGMMDSIVVDRNSGSDTLCSIKVHVVPTPGKHTYYKFFSKETGIDSTYIASSGNLYDSELVRQDEMIVINRGISNPLVDQTPYYHTGNTVRIKMASIGYDSYEYWSKYSEAQLFSPVVILPYSNKLKGNLEGAIGYWFGYGITEVTVKQ